MNVRFKKRIGVIIVLFIVLVTVVFNLHKIRFALGMYNIYAKEKNTEVVLNSPESIEKVELFNPLTPIVDSVKDEDNEIKEEEIETEDSNSQKDDPIDKWPDSNIVVQPDTTKAYVNIVSEYNTKLESLRSSFESDLENLIEKGIDEYKSGVSTAKLGSKYLSSGTQLEKSSDSRFNALVKEMEKELKVNNHDTKIIGEVKEYYTSFKTNKKSEVIGKGMGYMK